MQLNPIICQKRNNSIGLHTTYQGKFKQCCFAMINYKEISHVYAIQFQDIINQDSIHISRLAKFALFQMEDCCPISIKPLTKRDIKFIQGITFYLSIQPQPKEKVEFLHSDLQKQVKNNFSIFNDNSNFCLKFKGYNIQMRPQIHDLSYGKLGEETLISFSKEPHQRVQIIQDHKQIDNFFQNRESKIKNLKVGGHRSQLQLIQRRVFSTRTLNPRIVRLLGLKHIRGILLHGPPGTGKTLIARQISKILDVEPKIVNGPEIFNQFVGKSQQMIRNLFADAIKEQQEKGLKSKLHCIIFDQIDAICKKRGTQTSNGVYDQIVNQLLTCIDGYNALGNILVIGITNRKDLIDEAVLRPGRLQVHIQVNIPDQAGRLEILNIHTQNMNKNNFFDDSADFVQIAKLTKNYTGAELQGVVKSAQSFALQRWKNLPVQKQNKQHGKINQSDFINGIKEVKPQFGKDNDILQSIVPKNKITLKKYEQLMMNMINAIQNLDQGKHTFLIRGDSGVGKTVIAAQCALANEASFTKIISSDRFLGLNEGQTMNEIVRIFEDAERCTKSLIVLDDLLRLIDFIPLGSKYNSSILNLIINLIKKVVSPSKKQIIIATVSNQKQFDQLGLIIYFKHIFSMQKLNANEIVQVLKVKGFQNRSAQSIAEQIKYSTVNEIIDISNIQKSKNIEKWLQCWKNSKKSIK